MVAKKSRSSSTKKSSSKKEQPAPPPSSSSSESEEGSEDDDMKLTLEALDAMSDSSDESVDDSDDAGAGDGDIEEDEEYSKEAEALRKMISDGKFDGLLKSAKKGDGKKMKKKDTKKKEQKVASSDDDDDDDDEFEELELGPNHLDTSLLQDEEDSDADDNNSKEQVYDQYWRDPNEDSPQEESSSNENSENEEEEDQAKQLEKEQQAKKKASDIALQSAIQCSQRNLPWAETFAIVPPTPLPFGPPDTTAASSSNKKRKLGEEYNDEDEDEEEYVDIHDDLKREVAFYDNALEAVTLAREQCEKVGIPFTRPNDFFAEMVKSDDHMAKIKDRLIFETKKMEAVERRKSNKEQTVMAKERHAHRIAEKSKQKKEHMKSVEDWKKNAERNRSGLDGKVREDDEDQLGRMGGGGVNKKRMNANKKYGFGGKSSRFKQNDKSTLNDMSGFNPRGGFGGMGQKSSGGMGGGKKKVGGGKKRPGKRARDAGKR